MDVVVEMQVIMGSATSTHQNCQICQQQTNTEPQMWYHSLGMKVWVTHSGKEPRSAKVFAEGGGNTEWAIEKDNYEYQLRPRDQLQTKGL